MHDSSTDNRTLCTCPYFCLTTFSRELFRWMASLSLPSLRCCWCVSSRTPFSLSCICLLLFFFLAAVLLPRSLSLLPLSSSLVPSAALDGFRLPSLTPRWSNSKAAPRRGREWSERGEETSEEWRGARWSYAVEYTRSPLFRGTLRF
jgi:hypothetical protein